MAAVLLMVGRRQEVPEVVSRLLDVQATPCKPQYSMAPEVGIVLSASGRTECRLERCTQHASVADQCLHGTSGRCYTCNGWGSHGGRCCIATVCGMAPGCIGKGSQG